jgi:hypothetical protein
VCPCRSLNSSLTYAHAVHRLKSVLFLHTSCTCQFKRRLGQWLLGGPSRLTKHEHMICLSWTHDRPPHSPIIVIAMCFASHVQLKCRDSIRLGWCGNTDATLYTAADALLLASYALLCGCELWLYGSPLRYICVYTPRSHMGVESILDCYGVLFTRQIPLLGIP